MARFIEKEMLTFDDVLLVPQYTKIISRGQVSLKTRLTKDISLDVPIISANMDTITESHMMIAMSKLGGVGILHRFLSVEKMLKELEHFTQFKFLGGSMIISVGLNDNDARERMNAFADYKINYDYADPNTTPKLVCIDVAHGDCERVINSVKYIKKAYPEIKGVIAGNIATAEAARRLCNAGVDAIKVGIGPGSMCSTRIVTGCGVPQLNAILECSKVANKFNVPVIADGGIRNSGDIVKALAAGASTVMLGNLLSGTFETPGETEIVNNNNEIITPSPHYPSKLRKVKKYRGMASRDAMVGWKGDCKVTPEGESTYVEYKGIVSSIIENLLGGIRSGMTYCDAINIEELQNNAVFCRVSPNCIRENKPHGKD